MVRSCNLLVFVLVLVSFGIVLEDLLYFFGDTQFGALLVIIQTKTFV
jgi:hypothetical protein